MANLLTTAQISAIEGGAKIRQVWSIVVPSSSGGTPNFTWGIHDDASGTSRVIRHGSRSNSAYNVSLMQPGDLDSMAYELNVDNSGGEFFPYGTGNFFKSSVISPPSTYQALPQECLLKHQTYVWSAGAWSELPNSPWIGRIVDVTYGDVVRADGSVIYDSATIRAEGYLNSELRKPWTLDHGTTSTVTTSYTPSGLYIGSATSGWDLDGGNVRLWFQFTVNASCAYRVGLRYDGIFADLTGTASTIQASWTTSDPTAPEWTATARAWLTSGGGATYYYTHPEIPIIERNQATQARPW